MNRIDTCFKGLKAKKKKAIILFVTSGDPSLKVTEQFLDFAQKAGVDIVELGVPFSDPLADGPVIQASSYRALKKKVSLKRILGMLERKRARGLSIPVCLMSSYNPVNRMNGAASAMQRAGVDGIIVPDCPIHESLELERDLSKRGIHLIRMSTPTTDRLREKRITSNAKGFLYYVSLIGLTGGVKRKTFSFKKDVARLRRLSRTPVCVGFGISTPGQAAAVSSFSDGVIVGSALVTHLEQYSKSGLSQKTKGFVRSLVKAVKGSRA